MVERKYEKANVTWLNESDKLESNVIYLLTFNDDGKEMYYVGKTTATLIKRVSGNYDSILPNPKSLVQQVISKLKHFTISILCKCNTKEELKVKEEYYTLQYRSNEREFGYNIRVGDIPSIEQCKKRSEFMKNYNPMKNDEYCKKLSTKCKSIPDNIIFDSIKKCYEYYSNIYGSYGINDYLDNGKIHIKSGQTFVRLI